MRKIFILLFAFLCFSPIFAKARDISEITDWYIKDFQSEITVNKDSSLLIKETILADCGNLPNKHGIFRVLPTQTKKTQSESIQTPIELISITDSKDNKLKYSTINNSSDHTITWKIGDPDITVRGINEYKIIYKVKNAIRFDNNNFDELYWNLNGNFWDIETDKYSAQISFPKEVIQSNTEINLYSGKFGNSSNDLAAYKWLNNNVLLVSSNQTLKTKEGITLSVTLPKDIFAPYIPTFIEKYGQYFWFLIPIIAFVLCFSFWYSNGRDPKINSAIAPMFEIPENLDPLTMGIIMSSGSMKTHHITATIINLAVKGYITIEEIENKSVLSKRDYALILKKNDFKSLSFSEQQVIKHIFTLEKINETVRLPSLENNFYAALSLMRKDIYNLLIEQDIFAPSTIKNMFFPHKIQVKSLQVQIKALIIPIAVGLYFIMDIFLMISSIFGFHAQSLSPYAWISIILPIPIFLTFLFLMPKLTLKGAKLVLLIKGFRMYIEKAEKYRQQFNEKENIFEKFLPYAILFGLTNKWIKAMNNIYGEEYLASYHPAWYCGASISNFNVDSFTTSLNNLSSTMSSTFSSSPSSSGSGGGGFSGGGGGGGGGGGW